MSPQGQNLQQQVQQRATQSAQNFYGQSIGGLNSQVQNYRGQLERFTQQLPEGDAKAQLQEMIDSYTELEGSMHQAAQDAGVEDAANEAAQQTNQQMRQFAQGAAGQAEDASQNGAAGQAQGQAQGQVEQEQQEPPNATRAGENKAKEMGVDLFQVQGTGAQGRITVRDVIGAASQ
jgi:pyruvate/2-oxoglutarate dehydrogenase complex dihydrolipoamide acyltransferase (E2) component